MATNMGRIDPIALHIIREAKKKHVLKMPCIYCQTMIKPPKVFCNENHAYKWAQMIVSQWKTF